MKKIKIKKQFPSLSLALSGAALSLSSTFTLANTAHAAFDPTDISKAIHLDDPLKSTTDLKGFVANVLGGVVLVLTPALVIMLIYSGFLFVSAKGNTEKLGEAKKALMWTIVGAAIVIGAKGLETILENTVGALAS